MNQPAVWELLLGLALGGGVALWGERQGALLPSGAFAVALGSLFVFGIRGWTWGALWIISFAGMVFWSHYGAARKETVFERLLGRAQRDWRDVLAYSLWALLLVALTLWLPSRELLFAAYLGALATMTADIWGTEVGVLSRTEPRLLPSGRAVAAGTPGAISSLGIVAALGGGWLLGFAGLAAVFVQAGLNEQPWEPAFAMLPLIATVGGLVATLVDSFLGATAQAIYYCEYDERRSEEPVHVCGRPARQVRGWRRLTGRGVDFVASLIGAAAAAGWFAWLARTLV